MRFANGPLFRDDFSEKDRWRYRDTLTSHHRLRHACRTHGSAIRVACAAALSALTTAFAPSALAQTEPATTACRVKGIEREVRCGSVSVPENPDAPDARRIAVHFAVVPAQGRVKEPDPLLVFAGGPGQSAIGLAGPVQALFAPINTRRDIVFIDQRGTGRSNLLDCEPHGNATWLTDTVDTAEGIRKLASCARNVETRADLRQYATWIAARDIEAVRARLGVERFNLWGASYGTRAALEYLRQYPARVRSVMIDGVAPAGMALPVSMAVDADAALERVLVHCKTDARCMRAFPSLPSDLELLWTRAKLGTPIKARDPFSGSEHPTTLTTDLLAKLLHAPLYVPSVASALPFAVSRGAADDFGPLFALGASQSNAVGELATLMHFAVVCAEDLPRMDARGRAIAAATRFGTPFIDAYERVCQHIPVRPVPEAFYSPPVADVPVLIFSGGADPATPPRHGVEVARLLPRVLHLTAPHLGHGVSPQGCGPQLLSRFIRQAGAAGRGPFVGIEDGNLAGCLDKLPTPNVFQPPTYGPSPRVQP